MSTRQGTVSPTADPILTLNDEAIAAEVHRINELLISPEK